MTFDEWMLIRDVTYYPTDDTVAIRKLRECWYHRDAEVESLRQQLASCDAEIERLKTVPMRYRRMAFNAQLQNENTQLCQQLAAALAAIKVKDEALNAIATTGVIREAKWCGMSAKDIAELALVTTADLKDVILCHAEPAAIVYRDYGGNGAILQTELADDEPLYRAWEPK